MADSLRRSRRKSGMGGVDVERKEVAKLVERSKRRKSESGSADLLEHRRLLKELEDHDQEENNSEEGEPEEDEEEEEKEEEEGDDDDEKEGEENNKLASLQENSSSSDSESDEEIDNDMKAAMNAALASIGEEGSSSSFSSKRRKQRKELNTRSDPSPYLNQSLKKNLVEVRNNSFIKSGKGSSIDIESLANNSDIYKSRHSHLKEANALSSNSKSSNVITSGAGWFNLPATEMTNELKQDLRAVRMRGALDPKRFYKALDRGKTKFVQVGTIIEGRDEYYSSRLTRKERKTNLVDELMADEKTRRYTKRKFGSIQDQKQNKKRFGKKKNTKKIGFSSKSNNNN